jgi:hypothetical protein
MSSSFAFGFSDQYYSNGVRMGLLQEEKIDATALNCSVFFLSKPHHRLGNA